MDRFSRSLALTKQSWSILRANPQLSLFPIVSTVVTIIVLASFAVPGFFMFENIKSRDDLGVAQYAFSFAFYLVSYFVVIFFNTGLVHCANEIFAGKHVTFGDGMRASFSRIGSIFVYALISATVGMILRAIAERGGIVGAIAGRVLGFVWTVATYFVPPILVIEGKNPIEAIKDSAGMLKRTWGENIIFNVSSGFVFGLLGLLALIPIVGGAVLIGSGQMVLGIAMILGAILYILIISLISTTLTGIFQTALYLYARTGMVPAVYDPAWVQQAFVVKPQRRGFGGF